ncbi:MAG: hypothetical protein QNJ91_05680 [Gammaproteobacteria bacterium]|nr:hypothetical protein [Gammaproteobacteria bacterium]
MHALINRLLDWLGRPRLVEFDYRDRSGTHHGRCYVRCMFGSQSQMRRMMHSCGYTNIRIAQ